MNAPRHRRNANPERPVALVTGAAGGLGLAIGRRLAGDGYCVALLDIDAARVAEAASAVDHAHGYACDITDEASVDEALERIVDELGQAPSVLVNNAGLVRFGDLLDHEVADFRAVVEVNLVGAFIVSRAVARRMAARGDGAIVNITSLNALAPSADAGAYPATKAALAKLTEQMVLSLAPRGIRVNAVAPGFINAGMSAPIYAEGDALAQREASVPAGRIGNAEDVAAAVSFLVSEEAGYIHGQHLVVDGGVFCSLKKQMPRKAPSEAER